MGTLTASRHRIAAHYHEKDLGEELIQFLVERRGLDKSEAKMILEPILIDSMTDIFNSDLGAASSTSASYYQAFDLPVVASDVGTDLLATNEPEANYWVSISERTGYRRLHRRGGCWVKARSTVHVSSLADAAYNSKCGHCWKSDARLKHQTALKAKVHEASDTSVSTSSESSSSDP